MLVSCRYRAEYESGREAADERRGVAVDAAAGLSDDGAERRKALVARSVSADVAVGAAADEAEAKLRRDVAFADGTRAEEEK